MVVVITSTLVTQALFLVIAHQDRRSDSSPHDELDVSVVARLSRVTRKMNNPS